ncbi:MAG: hypothetical protein JWR45_632 [Blastococcus sp.]|nr:hypothetical protein [Blastococcus sp.]
MAKDRTPASGTSTPASGKGRSAGKGSSAAGRGGRTRPVANVVTAPRRPWGLIAGAMAVVLFAAAVITYAVMQVNKADADKITAIDQIAGVQTYDQYSEAQDHVDTVVQYTESPPVGGPHAPPPEWADCTGTVYSVDVRHENAVHSLEHGAVWITYDPDALSQDDIDSLATLVEGKAGRMMSPYAGLDSPVSVQAWGHQLKVDSAGDPRIKQFADFLTLNDEFTPEPGATCENPTFIASPRLAAEDVAAGAATTAPSAAPATETAAP